MKKTSIDIITEKLNDALMNSLDRLDNEEIIETNATTEIARGNAISKTSQVMLNIINTNIRIKEIANKEHKTITDVKNELDK